MQKYILLLMVAMFAMVTTFASAKEQIFLGPANSGASSGGADWLSGANGAGLTMVDFDDAAKDSFDFTLSNSVAGKENNADWRCPPFSLGGAADGARPITFSFAYKFVNAVAKGNNMHVQLRFFDATVAPPKARTADVWINANIFEPWVSGTGRFGDFSVTTVPRSLLFKACVIAVVLIGICILIVLFIFLWRRRVSAHP